MNNQEKLEKLKEKEYQKYFGVSKSTFDKGLKYLKRRTDTSVEKAADYQY